MKQKSLIAAAAFALFAYQSLFAQHDHKPAGESAAKQEAAKPYPLDTCIVSGQKLGKMGEPVAIIHEGQEIKFCCGHCQPKFNKNPSEYLDKLHKLAGEAELTGHSDNTH